MKEENFSLDLGNGVAKQTFLEKKTKERLQKSTSV